MTFISFAQNFEDVILWRALSDVTCGRYVDIGANDPVANSVSYSFYKQGWRGVHVEPVPACAQRLREHRPDEPVLEAAVCDSPGEITLFDVPDTGLATAIEAFGERHKQAGFSVQKITVASVTLASVFDRLGPGEVHWLKVDVEGMEQNVLHSWGFHPTRPWVVVVEATLPNSSETNHHLWEHELISREYEFVYFDGLNRFYIHTAHNDLKEKFGPGPNVFDNFFLSEHAPSVGILMQERKSQEEILRQESERRLALLANEKDAQVQAIASELEEKNAYVSVLRVRIEEVVRSEVEALSSLHRKNIEFEERSKDISIWQGIAEQRLKQIGEVQTELQQIEARYTKSEATVATQAARLEELNQERSALVERLDEEAMARANDAAKADALCADLEARLAARGEDCNQLARELGELSDHYYKALEGAEALQRERDHLKQIEKEYEALTASVEQIDQRARAAEACNEKLTRTLARRDEQIKRRDSALRRLRKSEKKLNESAAEKQSVMDELVRVNEQSAERLRVSEKKLSESAAEKQSVMDELVRVKEQSAAWLIEHDAEVSRLHHRANLADLLARDLSAVKESRSWKVTAPIRWIGTFARSVRRKLPLGGKSRTLIGNGPYEASGAGIEESRVLRHLADSRSKEEVRQRLSLSNRGRNAA